MFEKSGKAALVISTLVALAALVSMKIFVSKGPVEHRTRVQVAPTWTDNRVNGSALNKLMTTKFPSSALMMDMAAFLRNDLIPLEWTGYFWIRRSRWDERQRSSIRISAPQDGARVGRLRNVDPW